MSFFITFFTFLDRGGLGWVQNGESGNDIEYVQITVGAGSTYRPLARGSNYAVTPTNGTSMYGGYTQLAIVDLETQVTNYF